MTAARRISTAITKSTSSSVKPRRAGRVVTGRPPRAGGQGLLDAGLRAGAVLADVETSKAVVSVEAERAGYVQPLVPLGEIVEVGAPLCRLADRAEELMRAAGAKRIYIETSHKAQYDPTRKFYEGAGYTLEALLKDQSISDILVNRADQTYVERNGRLELSDTVFRDDRRR